MRFWDLFVWRIYRHIYWIVCCTLLFALSSESYAQRNTNKSYRKRVCKGEGCHQTKVRSSSTRMNYPIGTRYRKVASTSRSGYRRSVCRGRGCYPVKYTVPQRDLNYKPSYNPRKAQRFSRYHPREQRIQFSLKDVGYACNPRTKKSRSLKRYGCSEQPVQFRLKEYRYSCTPRMRKFHSF
ncbi:MAG: hypothetical protein RML94_10275, partial [Bacteroidia bacterium]|nr:hypothetical protein [Bacteroidia bacterium]